MIFCIIVYIIMILMTNIMIRLFTSMVSPGHSGSSASSRSHPSAFEIIIRTAGFSSLSLKPRSSHPIGPGAFKIIFSSLTAQYRCSILVEDMSLTSPHHLIILVNFLWLNTFEALTESECIWFTSPSTLRFHFDRGYALPLRNPESLEVHDPV